MVNEKIYISLSIDKLTILAIFQLIEKGEECAFERLIKECFDLFPKRFCLRRYSKWPDSNRVYLSMMRCRNNGWIVGNEKSGFQITAIGRKIAKDVFNQLSSGKIVEKPKAIKRPRERGETIINFIKNSRAYTKFKSNKENFEITEDEFREMLGTTLETPPRILKQNFIHSLNICKDYKEEKLKHFLNICKKQIRHIIKL